MKYVHLDIQLKTGQQFEIGPVYDLGSDSDVVWARTFDCEEFVYHKSNVKKAVFKLKEGDNFYGN